MSTGQTNIAGGKALVGTAKPSDVRMGMTYPDGKELRSGTLDLTNLKPENIKRGVTIGGVSGGMTSAFEENILSSSNRFYNENGLKEVFVMVFGYAGSSLIAFKDKRYYMNAYGGSPYLTFLKIKDLRKGDRITVEPNTVYCTSILNIYFHDVYSNDPYLSWRAEQSYESVANFQLYRGGTTIILGNFNPGEPGEIKYVYSPSKTGYMLDKFNGNAGKFKNDRPDLVEVLSPPPYYVNFCELLRSVYYDAVRKLLVEMTAGNGGIERHTIYAPSINSVLFLESI